LQVWTATDAEPRREIEMATMTVTGRDGALTVAMITCKDAGEVEKVMAKLAKMSTRSYRISDESDLMVKVVCNKSQLHDLQACDWSFAPVFTFARSASGEWEAAGDFDALKAREGQRITITRRDGSKAYGYVGAPYPCTDGSGRAPFYKHAPPRDEGASAQGDQTVSGWSPPNGERIPSVGQEVRGGVITRVRTQWIPEEFGSLGGSPEYDSGWLWWGWVRAVEVAPTPSPSMPVALAPELD
jgi:hypothetical protein